MKIRRQVLFTSVIDKTLLEWMNIHSCTRGDAIELIINQLAKKEAEVEKMKENYISKEEQWRLDSTRIKEIKIIIENIQQTSNAVDRRTSILLDLQNALIFHHEVLKLPVGKMGIVTQAEEKVSKLQQEKSNKETTSTILPLSKEAAVNKKPQTPKPDFSRIFKKH